MSKPPLTVSNPHLRDPQKLREGIITSVSTSTAIETGEKPKGIAEKLQNKTSPPTPKRER